MQRRVQLGSPCSKRVEQVVGEEAAARATLVDHELAGLCERSPELLDLSADQHREPGVELSTRVKVASGPQWTAPPGVVADRWCVERQRHELGEGDRAGA